MEHPLRAARTRRKLTQRELAEMAGVDHSTIVKIENSDRHGSWETYHRLGRALGIDFRKLLPDARG